MLHRRSLARPTARRLALATGVLLVAAPLSSCGFDNATDQIYNSSAGVSSRQGPVDVLSAVVVSGQDGSGTFIATFSNNSPDKTEQVTDIGPVAGASGPKVLDFKPISLGRSGFVNLADVGGANEGVVLSGDIKAGYYVDLTFTFRDADPITLSVPVVADNNIYDGLDRSALALEEATSSPSATPSKTPRKHSAG